MAETKEFFRMEVLRWNMWRKLPLTEVSVYEDYDIDFNQHKVIFEVRAIPKERRWMDVMDQMVKDEILPPNLARLAFGLDPL